MYERPESNGYDANYEGADRVCPRHLTGEARRDWYRDWDKAEAEKDGAYAFAVGADLADNPYPPNSMEWDAWNNRFTLWESGKVTCPQ